ncbi:MAG: peptidase inhibitor family I36 protein [Acidimicrobiales bacterium]
MRRTTLATAALATLATFGTAGAALAATTPGTVSTGATPGAVLVEPVPASPQAQLEVPLGPNQCGPGDLCVWDEPNTSGSFWGFEYANTDWADTVNYAITDRDESWANDTSTNSYACVYHGNYADGGYRTIELGVYKEIRSDISASNLGESNDWGHGGC